MCSALLKERVQTASSNQKIDNGLSPPAPHYGAYWAPILVYHQRLFPFESMLMASPT